MGTGRAARRLPPALRKRARTEAELLAAYEALVIHLNLADRFQELKATVPDGGELRRAFLAEIGLGLMRELFVPFRPQRNDSPSFADGYRDWIAVGGGLLGPPWGYERFYQAMLIKAVTDLQGEKNKSREWVFKWLTNEINPGGPVEAAKRRSHLPAPYRRRETAGSLRTEFYSIPRDVRVNPERYLPSIKGEGTVIDLGFLTGGPISSKFPVRGLFEV